MNGVVRIQAVGRLAVALGLLCGAWSLWSGAAGQSRIERGAQYTYRVTSSATGQHRAPFLPLGWWDVGECMPAHNLDETNDAALIAHLDTLARYGINLVLMQDAADGRLVARRSWRAYPAAERTWFDVDGDGSADYRRSFGHPNPEDYAGRMRWFMNQAIARGIFTMVGVGRFIVPLPDQAVGWQVNLASVVDELKEHPGLFGWYLFDEPEVNGPRTAAKGAIFGNQHDPYTEPSCQPQPDGTQVCQATTDLLRAAYRIIKRHDPDHVVAVSVNDPQHFYSPGRFAWAYTWPGLNGPFDLDPAGRVALPADIVGVNLNPFVHKPTRVFYRDPNAISRSMQMVHEAVRRDGAWGSIYLAAQAQVASGEGRLPCHTGDNAPFRPLRDRDILWQMITPFIDGARGLLHYAHALTPDPGTGTTELARTQRHRIHRAMRQFREAGLDSMLLWYPAIQAGSGWRVDSLLVQQLTDDYHRPFAAPSLGDARRQRWPQWQEPAAYVRAHYNRDPQGHSARMDRPGINMAPFQHLRTLVLRLSEASHLVLLSNAYDARIEVTLSLDQPAAAGAAGVIVRAARFDLVGQRGFAWHPTPEVLQPSAPPRQRIRLRIPLEPYEVQIYWVEHR